MVAIVFCRWSKEHVDENGNTNRGVRFQMTDNSLKTATYYEPMRMGTDSTHFHHQPYPFTNPT